MIPLLLYYNLNTLQLLEFCNCIPGDVTFENGSIIVIVILEYNDTSVTSEDIIAIIRDAEQNGTLLPNHAVSVIDLELPNGGKFWFNFFKRLIFFFCICGIRFITIRAGIY